MIAAPVARALTPVVAVLEHLGVPYHIGGSVASSSYGTPRATADVDVVADLTPAHAVPFVRALQEAYYVDEDTVREAILQRRSFNLLHLETMIKVDLFIPAARAFDHQEMARARPQTLEVIQEGTSYTYQTKSPEDLVLRKLEWYRAGGEVSQRQWRDVLGILSVQANRLDKSYLNEWAVQLGLTDLLQRAIAEASPPKP